jgi:hypothetical protein
LLEVAAVREKLPFLSSVKYEMSLALELHENESVVVATRHELDDREDEHSATESETEGESESTKSEVEVAVETLPALSVAVNARVVVPCGSTRERENAPLWAALVVPEEKFCEMTLPASAVPVNAMLAVVKVAPLSGEVRVGAPGGVVSGAGVAGVVAGVFSLAALAYGLGGFVTPPPPPPEGETRACVGAGEGRFSVTGSAVFFSGDTGVGADAGGEVRGGVVFLSSCGTPTFSGLSVCFSCGAVLVG